MVISGTWIEVPTKYIRMKADMPQPYEISTEHLTFFRSIWQAPRLQSDLEEISLGAGRIFGPHFFWEGRTTEDCEMVWCLMCFFLDSRPF